MTTVAWGSKSVQALARSGKIRTPGADSASGHIGGPSKCLGVPFWTVSC